MITQTKIVSLRISYFSIVIPWGSCFTYAFMSDEKNFTLRFIINNEIHDRRLRGVAV